MERERTFCVRGNYYLLDEFVRTCKLLKEELVYLLSR